MKKPNGKQIKTGVSLKNYSNTQNLGTTRKLKTGNILQYKMFKNH